MDEMINDINANAIDANNEALPEAAAECGAISETAEKTVAGNADSAEHAIGNDDGSIDKIHIADEVIAQIITIAAGRISGVTFSSAGVGDGIAGFLGMKNPSRGVRIETDEQSVAVDLSVNIEYGRKINETAKALQDEIRKDLTDMTGLRVTNVNIHVLSFNVKDQSSGKPQKASRHQREQDKTPDKAAGPGRNKEGENIADADSSDATGSAAEQE